MRNVLTTLIVNYDDAWLSNSDVRAQKYFVNTDVSFGLIIQFAMRCGCEKYFENDKEKQKAQQIYVII